MTEESVGRNRLRRLPPIRRARLWRLYAEDGRRFLDFWMDGGRSLLGAKGRGIGTIAKAAVDMGLTRPFPSIREARLEKEVLRRYPGYAAARFYRDEDRAVAAAEVFLGPGEELRVLEPFADFLGAREPLGLGSAIAGGTALPRVAMPRLPCPAALAPAVLLFGEAETAREAESYIVPPLVLACAHRALSEFDRFAADYTEELWKRTDRRLGPFFERRGPCLYPRLAATSPAGMPPDYDKLFDAALGAGVLLSPAPELPSLIPGDFDDGELARLANALEALTR
jgi:hypothetical protein